ncbi:hypothetical protein [Endozoicomonas sp. ALC020]|uniref:hypothetical protein n=1 Tax=unclassified Endozoicomonas TaxID=2644528 RepID=UPI003BAE53B0
MIGTLNKDFAGYSEKHSLNKNAFLEKDMHIGKDGFLFPCSTGFQAMDFYTEIDNGRHL